MPTMHLHVLLEDSHLLAIDKPAGLPTMGAVGRTPTAHRLACQYLQQKYHKSGRVYLGVVHRLDAPASGVLLFARNSKAASRLAAQFRETSANRAQKRYYAVVQGQPAPAEGQLEDWIGPAPDGSRMQAQPEPHPGTQHAALRYRTLATCRQGTLLEIELLTGRKHQIRVQLASRGHPIWGDVRYGSRQPFARGIALHAWQLVFEHPVQHRRIEIVAHVPEYWPRFAPLQRS
jgi:23S rRNA pseudouridine1911/1915/1917 synthase